jgi:hypothetical protein
MRVSLHCLLLVLSLSLLAWPQRIAAQKLPISLTCTSNARAERGFGFTEKEWMAVVLDRPDRSRPFSITTVRHGKDSPVLRDKVFSGLDRPKPVIRSIASTEGKSEENAFEFQGSVVSRAMNAVFLTWTNDVGNKVWTAAIDLEHRRAIVALTYSGITYFGTEVETLDCR